MKIVIQALDFQITNHLESFTKNCVQKLIQFPESIIRTELILGEDFQTPGNTKFCKIRLISSDNVHIVSQYGVTFEEAVVTAITELSNKINKETRKNLL